MISISSDFATDKGDPSEHLRLIAESGFEDVHWVHHWNDDFFYTPSELTQLKSWFSEFGLRLHGVHASAGQEKCWFSNVEYQRKAGVELVLNRMEMSASFGSDFIVLHAPLLACDTKETWPVTFKSLDEIMPEARRLGVRIAIENMCNDDFAGIDTFLERYPADCLGICYDAGHGNVGRPGSLPDVERRADRIMALHIHDNNSFRDQHLLPFEGSHDWTAFAKTIAKTPCHNRINLEINNRKLCRHEIPAYLKTAFEVASKLEAMVKAERN